MQAKDAERKDVERQTEHSADTNMWKQRKSANAVTRSHCTRQVSYRGGRSNVHKHLQSPQNPTEDATELRKASETIKYTLPIFQ